MESGSDAPRLRDAAGSDLPAILALNQGAMPHVSSLSAEALAHLAAQSPYLRVGEAGGEIVAFLLALEPGADYASMNFRWFRDRYPSFVYVDRVVIGAAARRRGLGRRFYADLEEFARRRGAPRITLEVNLRPANPGSLAFHQAMGFREVGTQDTEGGTKTVSLQVKELGDEPPARG